VNASIDNLAQAANRARRILIKMLDRRDRGVLARASMWARRASVVSGRNPAFRVAEELPDWPLPRKTAFSPMCRTYVHLCFGKTPLVGGGAILRQRKPQVRN
jgi:hypothetical protein